MDWGTLASLAVTIVLALIAQTFGAWKWLLGQFRQRDEALTGAVRECLEAVDKASDKSLQAVAGLRAESNLFQDRQKAENARIDRELAVFREQMKAVPTQKEIADLFDRRVNRMEGRLESLVLELARNGVRVSAPKDDA